MVGKKLMPNGSFVTYKRRETRRKRGGARREDEVLLDRIRTLLSQFFSLAPELFSVHVFGEARAASRNARVLPAAPPTCSLFCVVTNRHRHLFAGLFGCNRPVPHCGS